MLEVAHDYEAQETHATAFARCLREKIDAYDSKIDELFSLDDDSVEMQIGIVIPGANAIRTDLSVNAHVALSALYLAIAMVAEPGIGETDLLRIAFRKEIELFF